MWLDTGTSRTRHELKSRHGRWEIENNSEIRPRNQRSGQKIQIWTRELVSLDTWVVRSCVEFLFFVGSPMGNRSMRPKTTLRVLLKELDVALIATGVTCEVMLELKIPGIMSTDVPKCTRCGMLRVIVSIKATNNMDTVRCGSLLSCSFGFVTFAVFFAIWHNFLR